jgi:transcriptional regulator with XRE-family HTH domain
MITLSGKLAEARKQQGWSLREAERRTGIPNAHISQLETGAIKRPGVATLIPLAAAYDVPLADLLVLAGHASFGTLDEHGHLEDYGTHDLWQIAAWLPRGREGEAVEWMAAHGIEVYRMWQPGRERSETAATG